MAKSTKSEAKNQKENSFSSIFQRIKDIFADDTVKFIIGIIIFGFGIFVLFSQISFMVSGRDDFNLLGKTIEQLQSEPKQFSNVCSQSGAVVANTTINDWFGFPALLIPVFLLLLGYRLCNQDAKYSIIRHFIYCAFLMIWTSLLLGAISPEIEAIDFIKPGGTHGVWLADWLNLVIGPLGLTIVLVVSMLIFCAIAITTFVSKIQKLFKKETWIHHNNNITDPDTPENPENTDNPENPENTDNPETPDNPQNGDIEIVDIPLGGDDDENNGTPENPDNGDIETGDDIPPVKNPDDPTPDDTDNVDFEIVTAPDNDQPVEENLAERLVREHGKYDPTEDLPHYKYPTFDLLKDYGTVQSIDADEQQENKEKIIAALKSYNVFIKEIKATVGPTITLYEIVPVEGTRINRIRNLGDDIAMSIAAIGIRIIAPMPGKGTIGIEVPNKKPQTVSMLSVLSSTKFQETTYDLPVALGKTITNEVFMVDLCKLPHLLVAGATGQGKSVGLNAIISSLLYKKHPSQLKIVLVDPKKTEFSIYSDIDKHFLAKLPENENAVIDEVDKAKRTLLSLCKEMDDRNNLLKKAHVRNIKEYNTKFVNRELNPEQGHHFLPYIVVIIDEYGDLIATAGKEVEVPISRIAAVARAAGIHMVIATQRPSANVVTGLIKANFPARMAFKVASMVDSRTILDASGANQLIGRGDMLFLQGSEITRVQCAFIDTPEVQNVCNFIMEQRGYPDVFALPEVEVAENGGDTNMKGTDRTQRDPMFAEIARNIVRNHDASTSMIQRRFNIGFNRAGRIMEQLEAAGIVGPANGSKKRELYVQTEAELENILDAPAGDGSGFSDF